MRQSELGAQWIHCQSAIERDGHPMKFTADGLLPDLVGIPLSGPDPLSATALPLVGACSLDASRASWLLAELPRCHNSERVNMAGVGLMRGAASRGLTAPVL
jgi:hypothetical protein